MTEPPLERTPLPGKPGRLRYWGIALFVLTAVGLASLLVSEARTSHFQSRELSDYANTLRYASTSGQSDRILFPDHGPFDHRLGYTRLPTFEDRLLAQDFAIDHQVRFSDPLLEYARRGFFPPYPEKTRGGLTLEECRGETLYAFRHPQRHYPRFDAIPPLIVEILLFFENRGLLDESVPHANPAVDWSRFAMAAVSQLASALDMPGQASGGSTLATQIEKFRHSPGGRTVSPLEKMRQMVSASVRGYLEGPQTLSARRDVALDYLNSVPLAAAPGYGEIHGLGDGLWIWFGADFHEVNRRLVADHTGSPGLQGRGMALRQVVALMIAQRRPTAYLSTRRKALEGLTDSYLRLLADADVIDTDLRDAALGLRLDFRDFAADPVHRTLANDKGRQMARNRLASLVGTSLHDLDRLDLRARTTLHGELQQEVTAYLQRLGDPDIAGEMGLLGKRLLEAETAGEVRYAFTLLERSELGFRVRVQTDSTDQPFDINQGSKLELGSTAKLRVLATYLEMIAELHEGHAGLSRDELLRVDLDPRDALGRWVLERLAGNPGMTLRELLDAAMLRRYSASPHEAFFTGGGRHTFGNYSPRDDGRRPTLAEALQESINLPFVRLLRDLVHHSTYRNEGRRGLLADDDDPRRRDYLARFADSEGRVFLLRFWRKYRDRSSSERLDIFLDGMGPTPERLAAVYRYLFPHVGRDAFADFLRQRLPAASLSERRIDALDEDHAPGRHSLSDQAYIASVHPLELWLLGYLLDYPSASYEEAVTASRQERQEVYTWLFTTRHRQARDIRIRTMLEVEAFLDIHQRWQRLGYPFEHLVPSLATALGSSGDRPAALAELMGIILNDGVRLPSLRIDSLHFAGDTPYETRFVPGEARVQRVMEPEVAAVLREALSAVVQDGTARRLNESFVLPNGESLRLGGKTGTGNNRFETVSRSGQVIASRARNRTATFVFHLGDSHVGTLTAYVPGQGSDDFHFTSALPVQVLKGMEGILLPYLGRGRDPCLPTEEEETRRWMANHLMPVEGHSAEGP